MSYFDDNFDRIVFGDLGDRDYDYQPAKIVTCDRCGKTGLHWEETDLGWLLYDSRSARHFCPAKAASADDFDDLS